MSRVFYSGDPGMSLRTLQFVNGNPGSEASMENDRGRLRGVSA
jgi:hypothetical protein